jgi:predicted nucleic-acid-binding protein
MIAVDTNVVVRHLTRDDPEQAERARHLMLRGAVISSTVMLETVWVLQSSYRYTRQQIAMVLDTMILSEGIEIENQTGMIEATAAYRAGLDFADALHLAGCHASVFATFDTDLAKRASAHFSAPNVITP